MNCEISLGPGYTLKYADDLINKLISIGYELIADWRHNDEQKTMEFNYLMQQFLYFLAHRNSALLSHHYSKFLIGLEEMLTLRNYKILR